MNVRDHDVRRGNNYAIVENDFIRLEDYDREYISFSGFFGQHDPKIFAAAPALFEACKQWLAGYDGWSDEELKRRADPATVAMIRKTRSAIAKAEGRA